MKKFLVVSNSGNTVKTTKIFEDLVKNELPRLISIAGKDCADLEDVCDTFCEQIEGGLNIVTTSHPDEPLSDVKYFVETFESDDLGAAYQIISV